jgi:hypothetical protein
MHIRALAALAMSQRVWRYARSLDSAARRRQTPIATRAIRGQYRYHVLAERASPLEQAAPANGARCPASVASRPTRCGRCRSRRRRVRGRSQRRDSRRRPESRISRACFGAAARSVRPAGPSAIGRCSALRFEHRFGSRADGLEIQRPRDRKQGYDHVVAVDKRGRTSLSKRRPDRIARVTDRKTDDTAIGGGDHDVALLHRIGDARADPRQQPLQPLSRTATATSPSSETGESKIKRVPANQNVGWARFAREAPWAR